MEPFVDVLKLAGLLAGSFVAIILLIMLVLPPLLRLVASPPEWMMAGTGLLMSPFSRFFSWWFGYWHWDDKE